MTERRLGPPLTDAERAALLASAMSLLGVPWKHMGRQGMGYGTQTGLDCLGAVKRVLFDIGRQTEDRASYNRTAPPADLLATLDAWMGARVTGPAVGPWHVVHVPFGRNYQHVGLTLPRGDDVYLWHCYNGDYPAGRVMWHRLDDAWRKRIHAGWAL